MARPNYVTRKDIGGPRVNEYAREDVDSPSPSVISEDLDRLPTPAKKPVIQQAPAPAKKPVAQPVTTTAAKYGIFIHFSSISLSILGRQ